MFFIDTASSLWNISSGHGDGFTARMNFDDYKPITFSCRNRRRKSKTRTEPPHFCKRQKHTNVRVVEGIDLPGEGYATMDTARIKAGSIDHHLTKSRVWKLRNYKFDNFYLMAQQKFILTSEISSKNDSSGK